jgi:hypothetical protein
MPITIDQAIKKLDELPILKGFSAPQLGFIKGNIDDKTEYKTIAEAACAALMDENCTGFTYLPGKKRYRLRGGFAIIIWGDCVEKGDHSYIKQQYQPHQCDEL